MKARIGPDELAKLHSAEAIAARLSGVTSYSYLGDFLLGAVDGAVTTFAIVAGAGLETDTVVVGICNCLLSCGSIQSLIW